MSLELELASLTKNKNIQEKETEDKPSRHSLVRTEERRVAAMPNLSVSDVHDASYLFDVDLQDEPYLVWIMREFCLNPLPPNYSRAINEVGE